MDDRSDWASRLAKAVASQLAERAREVQVHSIRATSPEVVEVIYTDSLGTDLKGIRLDLGSVRSGPERIRESSIDELAFDLVLLGLCEPRPIDEFLPPDSDGIRWLPVHRWLDD